MNVLYPMFGRDNEMSIEKFYSVVGNILHSLFSPFAFDTNYVRLRTKVVPKAKKFKSRWNL